jgi:hypothetical protein
MKHTSCRLQNYEGLHLQRDSLTTCLGSNNDSDLKDSRKDDDDEGEVTEVNESDGAELGRLPIAISNLNIY